MEFLQSWVDMGATIGYISYIEPHDSTVLPDADQGDETMTTATTTRTTAKFTRLTDGSWGVCITGNLMATGTQIRVNKSGGTMTTVITGETVSSVGITHIVRIVATPRPTTTAARPATTTTTYTTSGVSRRMTRGCAECSRRGAMCAQCAVDGD